MSEIVQEEVQSPCIGVCSIDEASGYCQGCYRTVDEIKGWWDMSSPEQAKLVADLEERQNQAVSFD
jgi:hypothetical protein